MTKKKLKLKFKVVGSYTIQTFYSQIFELNNVENYDDNSINNLLMDLAIEDENEGLENWNVDCEKVLGSGFDINFIIPINE